jgi:hypothetical protein
VDFSFRRRGAAIPLARARLKSRPKWHKSLCHAAARAPLTHHFYTITAPPANSHRNPQPVEALQQAADEFAASVSPMVRERRASGLSLREIAEKLAADGIRTARGGQWTAMAVKNVLDRSGGAMAKAA